jgi:tetratricopeptide (TPR) repeat protein
VSARGSEPARPRAVPFFDQGLFLVHLNRGKELARRGEHDGARRELEAALQLRPHDPEVAASLSLTFFHLGQYEDAERLTRDLLATHAESVPLLLNLGLILWKAGRDEDAVSPLARALELSPSHRKAHLALGLVLQRKGDSERAREHFRLAGAERPQGGDGDDTLAKTARTASRVEAGRSRPAPHVKPEGLETGEIAPQRAEAPAIEARVPEEPPSPMPAAASAAPMPGRSGPFTPHPGGFLAARCEDGVYVRRGVLTGRTGAPLLEAERRLTGALAKHLVLATGTGTVLLLSRGRMPRLRMLEEEFVSLDPGRLLGFEASLAYREDPAFELRRAVAPFLKLYGSGVVALAVGSEPARFEVTESQPLTLSAKAVVAFGGDLTPDLLEESDPLAEFGSGPVLRFTGTGYVLAE